MLSLYRYRLQIAEVALVIISLVSAVLIGFLSGGELVGWKLSAVLLGGLVIIIVLQRGSKGYWLLTCVGVASIAVGHRGIYLNKWTFVVPLEVIGFVLFGLIILRTIARREKFTVRIPFLLLFITGWGILRAAASILTFDDRELVLSWTIPFMFGFICFFVVGTVVKRESQLVTILRLLMVISLIMSILGIVEYYFPSVARALPNFFVTKQLATQDGFSRAEFGFWGYPEAASIITWGILIAFDQILRGRSPRWRIIAVLTFIFGMIAVYISGQRSSWIALGASLVLISINSGVRGWIIALIMAVALQFLPDEFWTRIMTVTSAFFTGTVTDTSNLQRLARWQWGWEMMSSNLLLGKGYGDWLLHNAFLEIGVKLGVIPAVAFLVFMVMLLFRIAKARLMHAGPLGNRYSILFFALSIPWIVQLAVETALQVPPFAAAQWFMLAVAWFLPDMLGNSESAPSTVPAQTPVREELDHRLASNV